MVTITRLLDAFDKRDTKELTKLLELLNLEDDAETWCNSYLASNQDAYNLWAQRKRPLWKAIECKLLFCEALIYELKYPR